MIKPSIPHNLGMWVWGTVTAVLAAVVVFVILTGEPLEVYDRIREAATAIGAVLAASALAWSHFFQTVTRQEESARLNELTLKVSEVSQKLDQITQK